MLFPDGCCQPLKPISDMAAPMHPQPPPATPMPKATAFCNARLASLLIGSVLRDILS